MHKFASQLLTWFYANRRDMPWRAPLGKPANPYHVWMSEVMLQQTGSATVHDYFMRFSKKWHTITDLANAEIDEVLLEWQGLGYYARARNLHHTAKEIAYEMGGQIPKTEAELKQLRGIGDYSSAAIAAIAYNQPCIAVDGNVRRVCARMFRVEHVQPDKDYQTLLLPYIPESHDSPYKNSYHGDMVQALMELGSLICTPTKPKCDICPVRFTCKGHDIAEQLPKLKPKIIQKKQSCVALLIFNRQKQVLLHQRPNKGLLGGMRGFPLSKFTNITDNPPAMPLFNADEILPFISLQQQRADAIPPVKHVFTHIKLTAFPVIFQYDGGGKANLPNNYHWQDWERVSDYPLPKLMQKIYASVAPSVTPLKPNATK